MTDPTDADTADDGQGSKRRRTRNYGERLTVSLRMDPDMHRRLMDLCDELRIPANTHVLALIEADLKKRRK